MTDGPYQLPVLHDDGLCLVVDKPGGVLTQAPADIDSVESRLKDWFREQNPAAKRIYCGVPHRLDRPASGAMVFCRNEAGTRAMATEFEQRRVEKVYWAVVSGEVQPEHGMWSDFMRKIPDRAQSECVSPETPGAQLAVLKYTVLARHEGLSWLEIRLETGRTHQIRLQCASRGFPILGDALYGSQAAFGPDTWDQRARWIALHARELGFQHPTLGKPIRVLAPLFETWGSLLGRFPATHPRLAAARDTLLPWDAH